MGIYGALSSAVTGLRAQSHALENISGNIANSQTTGYKRIETSFVDLIPDAPLKSQVPGAVLAQSRGTNNLQGDIQTSSNETFIALNTNGFFVVEPKIGQSDGNSVFAGSNYYTRRGDFEIDKDGLLVNGAGYYLKGLPIDPGTGNISGSVPGVIKLSNAYLAANSTKFIDYQANLPQVPKSATYNATAPNSEVLKSWMYSNVTGSPRVPSDTGISLPTVTAPHVPARIKGSEFSGTELASDFIRDSDMLTVTGANGNTYNLRFDTNGTPNPAVRFIDGDEGFAGTPSFTRLGISLEDLAGLHAAGGMQIGGVPIDFASQPTSDPSNLEAAVVAAIGTAFPGSTAVYDSGTQELLINYTAGLRSVDSQATVTGGEVAVAVTSGMNMNAMITSLQTHMRAQGGDPDLKVHLRNGSLEVSAGNGITAPITVQTTRHGDLTDGLFGLPSGVHDSIAGGAMTAGNTPGDLLVANGDKLTIAVGNVTRTYIFDTNGSVTPGTGEVEINAGQSLEAMLKAIETDLKTHGGPGAAGASLSYTAEGVKVAFAGNYLYDATVSGTAAGKLGINGTFTAETGQLDNIAAEDEDDFIAQSIEGGAITAYADNGAPAHVQLRWAKVDSSATGGTETWNLFYLTDSNATGSATAWKNVGRDYEFGGKGSLLPPAAPTTMINDLMVNGVLIGNVELRHGTDGVSQFADVNGTVSVSRLSQNGYGAGEFLSVAITDSGRVVATYSNGERIDMAQVVTAQFNGVNSLKRLDGGVYEATSESGEPIFDLSGTGILGGALEASNTDISDEFTKLIITQQAYSAGTRIVSTADEMLQEALNMVR